MALSSPGDSNSVPLTESRSARGVRKFGTGPGWTTKLTADGLLFLDNLFDTLTNEPVMVVLAWQGRRLRRAFRASENC